MNFVFVFLTSFSFLSLASAHVLDQSHLTTVKAAEAEGFKCLFESYEKPDEYCRLTYNEAVKFCSTRGGLPSVRDVATFSAEHGAKIYEIGNVRGPGADLIEVWENNQITDRFYFAAIGFSAPEGWFGSIWTASRTEHSNVWIQSQQYYSDYFPIFGWPTSKYGGGDHIMTFRCLLN